MAPTCGSPAGFFTTQVEEVNMDPSTYVTRLRSMMQTLQATPPCHCFRSHTHISNSLTEASHVFHCSSHMTAPTGFSNAHGSFFTIDYNGKQTTVSVDCLKPAHLDHRSLPTSSPRTSDPSLTNAPLAPSANPELTQEVSARTTQSGHRVHWPTDYVP